MAAILSGPRGILGWSCGGTALADAEAAWNPPSVKRITKLYNQYMKREGHTGLGSHLSSPA
jgi:hypothetical protein